MVETEVPVASLGSLFAYGKCGVEQGTVLEIPLIGILHLDDELLATLILAINIEDGLALGKYVAHMLAVKIANVGDNLLAVKHRVKEID